ncbi:hypothetical protein MGE_06246 [Candida albicans P75010]|nr:hypothetical protein MGE_06246 [Candida albicans P75010]
MTIKNFGSFNDPMNYLGLTHLLEHLIIFNHYQFINQLKKMGGDINGYTLGDFMNIYFDVLINEQGGEEEEEEEEEEEDYYYHQLNSILMKFSQLFNPAMGKNGSGSGSGSDGRMVNDKNLIMGEINSINEEHQLNITDDDKILYHGLRLLSNINHPFNKFATGNKSTLSPEINNNSTTNKPKLLLNNFINKLKLKYLLNNHLQYFLQPSNMILIVKSKLSLINLQNLVIKSFSQLENNHKLITPPPPGIQPFIDSSPPLFVKYNQILHIYRNGSNSTNLSSSSSSLLLTNHQQRLKPIKIRLILPLPNKTKTQSNSNSLLYENIWCNLIGDESINSLSFFLKQQQGQEYGVNLINSIFVFSQYISKIDKLLLIDITTTNNQCQKFIKSYNKRNNTAGTYNNSGSDFGSGLNIVINYLINNIWKFINQLIINEKKNRSILINCLNEYYKIFKFNLIFQQQQQQQQERGESSSINNRDQSIDEILNSSELLIYEDVPIEDLPLGNKYPQKDSINVDEFIYQTEKVFDISKLNVIIMTFDSNNKKINNNIKKSTFISSSTIMTDPYYSFDYKLEELDIGKGFYNSMNMMKMITSEFPNFEILQSNNNKNKNKNKNNDDDYDYDYADLFIPFSNSQLDDIVNISKYNKLTLSLSLPTILKPTSSLPNKSPRLISSNSNNKLWHISQPKIDYINIGSTSEILLLAKSNKILDTTTISFQIVINKYINNNDKVKTFIIIELIGEYLGKFLYYKFYKICQLYLYSWSIQCNHLINSSITFIISGPNLNIEKVLLKFIYYINQLLLNATTATNSSSGGSGCSGCYCGGKIDYKLMVELKNKIRFKYKNYSNNEDESSDVIGDDDCLRKIIDSSIMLLENDIWTIEQRIDALNLIEIDDLLSLMKVLIVGGGGGGGDDDDQRFINVLISTSMDEFNVINLNQIIMNQWEIPIIKTSSISNPQLNKSLSRILLPGQNELFKYKLTNTTTTTTTTTTTITTTTNNNNNNNNNVVIYNYIQIFHQRKPPPPSPSTKNKLNYYYYYKMILFKFINYFIQQKFNYQFRIINQIGYMIYSGIRINKQTMGLYFYISSSSGSSDINTYQEILDELNRFLYQLELELELELTSNKSQSRSRSRSMKLLEYIESFIKLTNKQNRDNNPYNGEDISTNMFDFDNDDIHGGGGGGGLPTNLLIESSTNHKSDNFNISSNCSNHQIYWESIITGNYEPKPKPKPKPEPKPEPNFQHQKDYNNSPPNFIDLYEILTPENILTFYKSKISINSSSKSSISIILY